MGQADGKYWIANNPNSQVTDAEAQKVEELAATNISLAELNALDVSVAGNAYGLNTPTVLVAGGAGDDVTIHSLNSGKIHHFGTGTGALGNADDDDAFTFKLPTALAAGEQIIVKPVNASVYAKILGFVTNVPASQTITYYAYGVADGTMIESASTATGTMGTQNTFVKLNASHFVLGIVFTFTSMSTTNWRLDIHDPGDIIAAGDIAVAAGNVGGYVS